MVDVLLICNIYHIIYIYVCVCVRNVSPYSIADDLYSVFFPLKAPCVGYLPLPYQPRLIGRGCAQHIRVIIYFQKTDYITCLKLHMI